jgi:hypothetical protein
MFAPPPLLTGSEGPTYGHDLPGGPPADATELAPDQPRLRSLWQQTKHHVLSDHLHYYSWTTLRDLGLAVALAAPIANTSLDGEFRDWYQRDVRSSGTDSFCSFFTPFGNGYIVVPAFAGLGLVGKCFEDRPLMGLVGEFGDRTTRAYLVGAPPMLAMQYLTGASRPGETSAGSHWKPFDDNNGVSGHAFMGAIPFITAAKMTENPWAKGTFYVLSTFTAWSRVNSDSHYLSQAFLGWWMGYLACRAVDDTQREDQWLTFTPVITPDMTGVAVIYRR